MPLVPEVALPEEIFQVEKGKVIGLVINPEQLNQIRLKLKTLGLKGQASYANLERIFEEMEYAQEIMKRLGCPVIDVTNRAVEETASKIMEIYYRRLAMSKKYVYLFEEGNSNMRQLLGGKGANLAEMTLIGLPVPAGLL